MSERISIAVLRKFRGNLLIWVLYYVWLAQKYFFGTSA